MNSSTLNSIAAASALALIVLFPNQPAWADDCPVPAFVSFRTFDTGADPSSVAVGDFDGDGKADLAVAIKQGVAVLIGTGGGAFEPAVSYRPGLGGTGAYASSVAITDFNADGKSDLAVANFTSDNLSVLLGRGDGTFQAAINYGTGIYPQGLALGDFNGDSKADLAVVNTGSADLHVLLGNGDGTLQTNVIISLSGAPTSIAAGDFDRDGKLDLAVGNAGLLTHNLADSGVSVLLGQGDGTFQAPIHYRAGVSARSVVIGDFNRDGRLDLAVANYGSYDRASGAYANGDVSVLLGNGDGTFQAAVNYDAGGNPSSIAVGDFNRDGLSDLAVVNSISYDVSVLLNNGDGTFQVAIHFGTVSAHSLAAGDFNEDGKSDLAVVGGWLAMLFGNGDGTFQAAPAYRVRGNPTVLAMADLNGDAKPDLAVTGRAGAFEGAYVSVLLGQDEGSFQTATNYVVGGEPNSLADADFNRDGRSDLAVANGIDVAVLLGEGGGAFQPAVRYAAGEYPPHSVVVGDFNGDGMIDLAVANSGPSTNAQGSVSILPGRGDGTFGGAVSHALNTRAVAIAAGDFNGDGKLDLVVANAYVESCPPDEPPCSDIGCEQRPRWLAESSLSVLLGQGDGTFQPGLRYDPGGEPRFVRTGDLNGDGILDLVVVNPSIPLCPCCLHGLGNLAVLLGRGDGTFQPAVLYEGGPPQSVVIADFNRDGASDLIVANYSFFYNFSLRFGRGDGTFQEAMSFKAGSPANSVAVADFNQDGQLDAALASYRSGVLMLLNTCTNVGIKLAVTRTNNAIILSWPLPYTNFILESTTHFSSTNWQGFSGVQTKNGRCEVPLPLTERQLYFRLRKT